MAAQRSVKLKDHTILSLDIGVRFIKVAEMRLAKGTVSLLNLAVRPTPFGMMENGQISDPVGIGRAIREMLATNKIKTRQVIVAVSGQSSVVVRPIELPKMTRKELVETMKLEVERHIPFTIDEVVMDYAPLVPLEALPEDATNMKILLAVAQQDLINAYLKMLSVAGLQPVAMDVEILATIRSLIDTQQEIGAQEQTIALVNIGASNTDISIVEKGNLAFTRSVPIAGDALTQAICDQLGRSFDEAEELKKEHGRIFLESAIGELPPPTAEDDASEANAADAQPLSFLNSYGAAAPAPATDTSLPQNVFSLDDEFDAPGPLSLEGAAANPSGTPGIQEDGLDDDVRSPFLLGSQVDNSANAAVTPNTPSNPSAPASANDVDDDVRTPFLLGSLADEETSIFRLGQDDDESGQATPVFNLDDNVDDEVSLPFLLNGGADDEGFSVAGTAGIPTQSPSSSPVAGPGPVFDFSTELEGQLPPPLSRPSQRTDESAPEPVASEPAVASDDSSMLAAYLAEGEDSPQDDGDTTIFAATPFVPNVMQDDVPAFERPDTPQSEIFERRIFESMLPALTELVTEIRRSLEYYSRSAPDVPIERIVLYGGTSSLPNLPEFIYQEVGLNVEKADPLAKLDLSHSRPSSEYIQELSQALPIVIGLGLRDMIA